MAQEAILGYPEKNDEIRDSGEFVAERGIDHNGMVNVIKSLHGFRYVGAQDIKRETWVLTDEGKTYAADGSPEVQLMLAIPPEGISRDELQKKLGPSVFKIGCAQAAKNKWIKMGKQLISRKVEHVEDRVKDLLLQIQGIGSSDDIKALPLRQKKRYIKALKARKLIIPYGEWKELEFKKYNYSAKGLPLEGGHLHPLLEVHYQLKQIFLCMGFEEMPTNNFVESSYDSLFQSQQHPARDSQDTIFLEGQR